MAVPPLYKAPGSGGSGGGSVAGSNTQVQFNDGGSLAGTSLVTIDKTNNFVGICGGVRASSGSFSCTLSGGLLNSKASLGLLLNAAESFPAGFAGIANYQFGTYTSNTGYASASINAISAESSTQTSTTLGANLNFRLVPVGSAALTTRVAFYSSGSVVLNASGSALSTSATDGFVYIGSGAGRPTGTPTANTGATPLYYDTTNDVLWAYNSSWKPIAGVGTTSTQSGNYSVPAYESTTIVTATATITLPDPATVPSGTRKTVIDTGVFTVGLATAAGSIVGSTSSVAFCFFNCVSDGSTKWYVSKTT